MGAGLYERRLVPWADDVPCAAGWHTPLLASRFGGTNRQNRARPSSSNSTLSRRRRINDRPYCKAATFSQARAEIILGIFPWCFTPELYAAKPEYIASLAGFVRQRPRQPVDAFLRQSDAVIGHDAEAQLGRIKAPTQITFGRQDVLTSTRFAARLHEGIAGSEVVVFEGCAHAPIYEKVAEFNARGSLEVS